MLDYSELSAQKNDSEVYFTWVLYNLFQTQKVFAILTRLVIDINSSLGNDSNFECREQQP